MTSPLLAGLIGWLRARDVRPGKVVHLPERLRVGKFVEARVCEVRLRERGQVTLVYAGPGAGQRLYHTLGETDRVFFLEPVR